ncbi:MAG: UvrABC system protein C, partial [Candidatus Portnoybacteria bacterium CG_4_8_14_3_um_filter_40_10]
MKKVLTKKIKQIPQKPGVYLFKDAGGRILYIGKARDILKRVKTHFSKSSNFFTGQFIEKISDIDWI